MASIEQIKKKEIYYSCNCGWLDEKHIDMFHESLYGSPRGLWSQLKHEMCMPRFMVEDYMCTKEHRIPRDPLNRYNPSICSALRFPTGQEGYVVQYQQSSRPLDRIEVGIHGAYLVRKNLSVEQKREVALAICMSVWLKLEDLQYLYARGNLFQGGFGSGYGQEDLVSNLIGFYVATELLSLKEAKKICGVVEGADNNLEILKNRGGTFEQNKGFTPIFDDASNFGCRNAEFPSIFSSIFPDIDHHYHSKLSDLSSDIFFGDPHGYLY